MESRTRMKKMKRIKDELHIEAYLNIVLYDI